MPRSRSLLVLLGSVLGASMLHAAERPGPVAGVVALPVGGQVRYEYHHDRNDLRGSCRQGNALVAWDGAGNLLRFDFATRALTAERVEAAQVVCLGGGDGNPIVAGFNDGRICWLDPTDLGLTEIVRVPGSPRWVGYPPGGHDRTRRPVVVFEPEHGLNRAGEFVTFGALVVQDLATGQVADASGRSSAFHLDGKRRLWLGSGSGYGDDGDGWGEPRSCSCVDLIKRAETTIAKPRRSPFERPEVWGDVRGFLELRNGQVWAYGGRKHWGSTSAYIHRVDRLAAEPLFQASNNDRLDAARNGKPAPPVGRPEAMIEHMTEEPGGDLLVFTRDAIFRTDSGLQRWVQVQQLWAGSGWVRTESWGRPDPEGPYPALRTIHRLEGAGWGFVAASAGDGFVVITPGREVHSPLPGQYGGRWIQKIKPTAVGPLFSEWMGLTPPWRLDRAGWSRPTLTPPVELDPDDPIAAGPADRKVWFETHIIVEPNGSVVTVSGTRADPGTRTTARWSGDHAEVVGRELSPVRPGRSFATPDGRWWNSAGEELRRFQAGRWQTVAIVPQAASWQVILPSNGVNLATGGLQIDGDLVSVAIPGPPWLLLDERHGNLLTLSPEAAGGRPPTLDRVALSDGDQPVYVRAALPWLDGTLLLATDRGLRLLDRATGKLGPSPVPDPGPVRGLGHDRAITHLARDGLNRLWLAGPGVWMFEPGSLAPVSLAVVPVVERGAVSALAADPDHPDGVIAALGRRGVVALRAERPR